MLNLLKTVWIFGMIGVCLAIIFVNHRRKEKKDDIGNYLTEGMSLGMCLGVAISTSVHIDIGVGISLGMLIGETVGMLMKKR